MLSIREKMSVSILSVLLIIGINCIADSTDNSQEPSSLPKIVIVGTGGTIAGKSSAANDESYTAGKIKSSDLIDSVPGVDKLADLECIQYCNVPSQDISENILLGLSKKIIELAKRDDVDGIVITHGTDTMEETAYFLNLTVHTAKPIIVTGAMRPSNAISADGPMNLYTSVAVAASKQAVGKGVLIVMNNEILLAREATKANTTNLATFVDINSGPCGIVNYSKVKFYMQSTRLNTVDSPFDIEDIGKDIPDVFLIATAQGMSISFVVDEAVKKGYKGIVVAGLGDGNIFDKDLKALENARKQGVAIVMSSRTGSGDVLMNSEMDNTKYKFNVSDDLNPQKARILLQLILSKTNTFEKIQKYFDEC